MADTKIPTMDDLIAHYMKNYTRPSFGALGDLAGAYQAYTAGNRVKDAYGQEMATTQDQLDRMRSEMDSMPSLDSMFGPDSVYATSMAQQLAAKDAAAGRLSQYGPRMAQVAAALSKSRMDAENQRAQMRQNYNTAQANLAKQRSAAAVSQEQAGGQQLASLFQGAKSLGLLEPLNKAMTDISKPYIEKAATGLSNMFGINQPDNNQNYGFGYGTEAPGATSTAAPTSSYSPSSYNTPSYTPQPQQIDWSNPTPMYGSATESNGYQAPQIGYGYGNPEEWYGY